MILFFRMGDFYETFDEDAQTIAEVLDIALTSREMGRGNRVPMAGIPYHSADSYLGRLLSAGYKVAIAEQVSEPTGKGIVDRQVTGVVTPGTVTNPDLLQTEENTFIAAYLTDGDRAGLALADVTTGEFAATTLSARNGSSVESVLVQEIERIAPREVVTRESEPFHPDPTGMVLSTVDELDWRLDEARATLLAHFNAHSLEPFGCEEQPLAARAAGALLAYLQQTQLNDLRQITTLYTYSTERYMQLDRQTRRNLEIEVSTSRMGGTSLVDTIDATMTAPALGYSAAGWDNRCSLRTKSRLGMTV